MAGRKQHGAKGDSSEVGRPAAAEPLEITFPRRRAQEVGVLYSQSSTSTSWAQQEAHTPVSLIFSSPSRHTGRKLASLLHDSTLKLIFIVK